MAYCRSAGEVVMKALSVENSSPAEACELYARAIAVLLEGVQGDYDFKRKQSVKAKILQYMTRLERMLKLCRENVVETKEKHKSSSFRQTPCQTEGNTVSAPTLSEPGAAEEEQVSNTQEIETLDRRSSTQVDTSSLSSELSSLHYEESDLYSLSSELEVAEESVVKDEEKLRQVLPDAIASRDALASVNRIAGELRGDPEMWELEEELKRILEEAA